MFTSLPVHCHLQLSSPLSCCDVDTICIHCSICPATLAATSVSHEGAVCDVRQLWWSALMASRGVVSPSPLAQNPPQSW